MTAAGQEKTILFHTGYEDHGQSFWDYSGPGTLLWDWYGYPLPLVAMWNVLNHHLGLSNEVGFVRPPGANLAIFQDLRNGRGVIVAYEDREAKSDVSFRVHLGDLIAPRNGTPVPFTAEVELTAGHELLFVPLMHGLDNNATNLSIGDLVITVK